MLNMKINIMLLQKLETIKYNNEYIGNHVQRPTYIINSCLTMSNIDWQDGIIKIDGKRLNNLMTPYLLANKNRVDELHSLISLLPVSSKWA